MTQKVDIQKLIAHLQVKWGNRPCPMCGQTNWNVSDKAFELREFQGGDVVLGAGPIIPVIPVTCNNCGNTAFVNAIVSKAIDNQNPVQK